MFYLTPQYYATCLEPIPPHKATQPLSHLLPTPPIPNYQSTKSSSLEPIPHVEPHNHSQIYDHHNKTICPNCHAIDTLLHICRPTKKDTTKIESNVDLQMYYVKKLLESDTTNIVNQLKNDRG